MILSFLMTPRAQAAQIRGTRARDLSVARLRPPRGWNRTIGSSAQRYLIADGCRRIDSEPTAWPILWRRRRDYRRPFRTGHAFRAAAHIWDSNSKRFRFCRAGLGSGGKRQMTRRVSLDARIPDCLPRCDIREMFREDCAKGVQPAD